MQPEKHGFDAERFWGHWFWDKVSEKAKKCNFSHFFMSPTAPLEDTERYKTHTRWDKMSSIEKTWVQY